MRLRCAPRRAALLFVLCAAAAWGQSFNLDTGRERIVSLDGDWRFHPGDSPTSNDTFSWAAPAFDDSSWKLLDSTRPWSVQGYANMGGFGWYRFTVHIPAGDKPTDLLLAPTVSSYQIYA